jgi:23S rRNA pseudouridine2605 synthase
MSNIDKKTVRLAKFLAASGVASRRGAEELITQGKVKIGEETVINVAQNVSLESDNISVNGQLVALDKKVYYLLNKPVGYICSVSDPHNEKTVLSLVPAEPKVVPVGRLDKDSDGLLLLTNDGDLVYRLTHPKFKVKKTYLVKVDKNIKGDLKKDLLAGLDLEEGFAKADEVTLQDGHSLVITIHQGWKRQIRRMLEVLGYQTLSLTRLSEGQLTLGDLPSGKYRILKKSEII